MKNKESTRAFSDAHEKSVCKALGGRQTSNSGANRFEKGDVIVDQAYLLVECKCSMSEKSSFSIKKEWLEKIKEEAFRNRLMDACLCFNFAPNGENYYVIDEKLMKNLMEFIYDSH
jgi:hypothetical protein